MIVKASGLKIYALGESLLRALLDTEDDPYISMLVNPLHEPIWMYFTGMALLVQGEHNRNWSSGSVGDGWIPISGIVLILLRCLAIF